MALTVRVAITDDTPMHRSMLRSTLVTLSGEQHALFQFEVIAECESGAALLNNPTALGADLITLDIRMPDLDGLGALLMLRRKHNLRTPICMVSSEQAGNIDRFRSGGDQGVKQLDNATKLSHLAKIEQRVLTGTSESGKINNLLEGCEVLRMDPLAYAEHLGASGFLVKPFSQDQARRVLPEVINGKRFAASTCLP